MAQFDLKNATFKIKDGYSGPGGSPAVNLMAGYMAGAVTMTVDGFVGAVANGDTFTVVGSDATHTITAHTETATNTTSITFSPGLTGAVVDDAIITVLPHELEILIGEGNCSYNEKINRVYVKNRGRLSKVRNGDEEPVEVKFDFIWEHIKASVGKPPTVEDVLKKRGVASTWVSTSADPCEPYAVDIVIEYTPPCEAETMETITLLDFRHEELDHNAKEGTISCSGKCNVTEPTVVRAA